MVQDKQWSIFEGIVACKVEFLQQSALEGLSAVAISYMLNWQVLGCLGVVVVAFLVFISALFHFLKLAS